ncbi:MAG: glutamate dehydrogenase, partial [Syntrophomonadaceae bacterium]|nr:glutamate dehydrogenase [Syntrophomonadaceae bacterium]
VGMGGSLGRTEATGYGLIYTVREALREQGIKIENTSASIQGFGNVAQYAAQLYQELGGHVVSVCCWDNEDKKVYAFHKDEGLDGQALADMTDSFGSIDKDMARDMGCKMETGDTWIEQDVDILIPAALENQITMNNVGKISKQVKFIVEGANGPVNTEADQVLRNSDIFVIPDFLANAGGVTCSYFEQVQSNNNYYWEKEDLLQKLDTKMTSAFRAVSELSRKNNLYMRDAAYVISINRVAQAVKMRGWV